MGYWLQPPGGVSSVNGHTGSVTLIPADLGAAPLASPALTGVPTAPTPATADNSTTLATTAHVQAKIAANAPALAPVQSVAGRTGAVTLAVADIAGAQAALGFTPVNKAGDTGIGDLSMGALTATKGTFSGALTATTGTFSGQISATIGKFSNNINMFTNPTAQVGMAIQSSGLSAMFGTRYSTGSSIVASNAVGIYGVDTWTQGYASYGSLLVEFNYANGLQLYSAAAGKASGNFITFWGSPVFTVSPAGALSATTGTFSAPVRPGSYTVATLPAGTVGQMAYATDARKAGEGAGAGTGLLLTYTNGAWRDPSQAYAVATA